MRRCPAGGICHTSPVRYPIKQVDVFGGGASLAGNPVAVVLDAEDVAGDQMQRVARWTNLSETTFLLPPTVAGADYRVRIFTPAAELPFAGHPTLGTCHAWLARVPLGLPPDAVVQQCEAGLVTIRPTPVGLAFAAPALVRRGPPDDELVVHIASMLGVASADITAAQWVDNGPGWVGVLLDSAGAVLRLRPGRIELPVGVIGPHPPASPCAFEVRAFLPADGGFTEDPVTGSLNASLAQWLVESGRARAPYVVSQGTAVGAAGRVHIDHDEHGVIWVGGATTTVVDGTIEL